MDGSASGRVSRCMQDKTRRERGARTKEHRQGRATHGMTVKQRNSAGSGHAQKDQQHEDSDADSDNGRHFFLPMSARTSHDANRRRKREVASLLFPASLRALDRGDARQRS